MQLDMTQIIIGVLGILLTITSSIAAVFWALAKKILDQSVDSLNSSIDSTKETMKIHIVGITDQLELIASELKEIKGAFQKTQTDVALHAEKLDRMEQILLNRPCLNGVICGPRKDQKS
jgi:hypothetical protein